MKLPRVPALAELFVGASFFLLPGLPHSPGATVFHHPHDVCGIVVVPPNFPDDPSVFTASHGSMNLFLCSHNRGFGWRNKRSGMRGHQIADCEIAPDWDRSKLIYAALDKGGLQRSTDGGETWEPPLIQETVTQVEVAEPVDGSRIVVCGGESSVWRSTDGGDNWTLLRETPATVQALAISTSFTKEPVIAVGTAGTALYVKNGTKEWTEAIIPSAAHAIEFSPDFAQDRTIWVGTHGHGLLKSVDAGLTFDPVPGLVPIEINDIVLAPTWPKCRDIFVATPADGVHSSRDGGTTWVRMPLRVIETRQTENHYRSLAISARYPEDPTVYCGAYEGLYCTNNAGENWFELNLNPTRIGRKIAISRQYARDGQVFLAGYGNPLAVSDDAGKSWEFRSRGSRALSAYSIAASPMFENDKLLMLGVGPGVRRSTDAGLTWEMIELPPVSPSAKIGSYETRQLEFSPDFANDQSVFALSAGGFYHSMDAGKTWQGHEVPVDWTWRMAIAPDWNRSRTAFLGGYNVWRSDNGGDDWQRLTGTGKVLGITCAPDFATSGEVFLVSQQRGLLRSKDRGTTWTPVKGAFQGFSPTGIRLSPDFSHDHTIFVSTLSGGMFWSRDRGENWERCAQLGSPVDTCFDFVLSPEFATDKTLFGCTYDGVVKTIDAGKTWKLVTNQEIYDDARDPWLFRGHWTRLRDTNLFGYGAHRTRSEGVEGILAFTGTGIRILGVSGPDHGICEILIDGKKVAEVDCFTESMNPEHVVYETTDLEQGFHDICVRALGKADPRSTNKWVSVDAAIVNYSSEDDNNRQFAQLENLYLTPDASYARETQGHNLQMADLRKPLQETPNGGSAQPDSLEVTDAELLQLIQSMREQLDHMVEDMNVLRDRIKRLDRAIQTREKSRRKGRQP